MCTVNDEDEVALMIEKELCTVAASNCRKCQERETEVVLRGKDPYCRTCFIAYATHKFRASLGKSKMVRKGDKILIGFSGSDNCMALIHLIQAGFDEEVHKRLVFEPCIIYIDDGAAFNVTVEERSNVIKNITSTLKKCNIKCFIANLESIFSNDDSNIYCDINSELAVTSDSKLSTLFSNIKCATTKEDLLIKIRNNLLLKIAARLNCCKIITGENLVSTASKLLSNVSLGRGAQLPFDIGFCDSRDKNIKVLRPLQDFSREEIEFFNSVYNLECVKTYSSKSNENSENSLQALTRQFIDELQENFPSTVSTVYRTGAKLTVENEAANAIETCSLCLGPIDTNVIESSSLQATVYSSIISNSGPEDVTHNGNSSKDTVVSDDSSCGKIGGKCKCSCTADERISVTLNEAVSNTCYGCRLILKNLNSVEDLPQQVLRKIQESNSLRQMKNEIQDFLL